MHKRIAPRSSNRQQESGIVMVMALICLVLMLVAAIALTRSSTNSLLQAGNLAFKRDLLNQAERGMAAAVKEFSSGTLMAESARIADQLNLDANKLHYSSSMLASNEQGIPNVLVNDGTFASAGMLSSQDYTDTAAGIAIRTVVDRQCTAAGAYDTATCVGNTPAVAAAQTGSMSIKRAKGESRATYRISVRVTGPRNTQVFHQMVVAY
ncbi:hypothetical protein SAMN05216303_102558 [Rhodoferax sp. OV413]|uniref:pilus assembly PilX family protein n=1 Tax=Rhodoferax sp. OV413 TaxID=1855285 RepID=UPI0008898EE0|nr:hypothetical protein [Rhodoferax sp. OV413]SDO86696.1 hypothetical protein SAMN05216303_102558 [Rhodoferax sp. OV413]